MNVATTIGKRSDFSVSTPEFEAMAEVNARSPNCKVTMFHRESGTSVLHFLVFSIGSRRKTLTQATPFNDVARIIERAEQIARMASKPSRPAQYVDDPDVVDLSPFLE